jgi:hypothetical protein
MPSPYFTTIAPYFAQQDQNLNPVFQNIAQQQQNQNAALQQQMQNNQMAGQKQGGGGSMNPMTMAAMLRKGGGASPMDRAAAYFGTQNTPEMQAQVGQLGSNTWNPMSDYNMGTNGWGSFGE